jgi:hypothetical protein
MMQPRPQRGQGAPPAVCGGVSGSPKARRVSACAARTRWRASSNRVRRHSPHTPRCSMISRDSVPHRLQRRTVSQEPIHAYSISKQATRQALSPNGCVQIWGQVMQVSILSSVEGCDFSGESVQTRILCHPAGRHGRQAQNASAPKNERTCPNRMVVGQALHQVRDSFRGSPSHPGLKYVVDTSSEGDWPRPNNLRMAR